MIEVQAALHPLLPAPDPNPQGLRVLRASEGAEGAEGAEDTDRLIAYLLFGAGLNEVGYDRRSPLLFLSF